MTNDNDSDEILTQVLMALPENRVGKAVLPGSEELAKQTRSITFRAASAASSGPFTGCEKGCWAAASGLYALKDAG